MVLNLFKSLERKGHLILDLIEDKLVYLHVDWVRIQTLIGQLKLDLRRLI